MNRFKVWGLFHSLKNFIGSFHLAIIASIILISVGFSGCGYKTAPVYVEKKAK